MVRIGALISLASGCVVNYALGSLRGKGSGEQALLREVSVSLASRDLLLADALHCTWWALQMLIAQGVDVLMPNDGRRRVDSSKVACSARPIMWCGGLNLSVRAGSQRSNTSRCRQVSGCGRYVSMTG